MSRKQTRAEQEDAKPTVASDRGRRGNDEPAAADAPGQTPEADGESAAAGEPRAPTASEAAPSDAALSGDARAGAEAMVGDPLVALQRERDALQERLMRLAAEFDNYRKRTAREYEEIRRRAGSDVLREMIELVDNFERALESPAEDAEGLRKGIELIHQQLLASLKKFGIEDISADGMAFDPQQHEALMMVDSDEVDSQHVVQVIQKGYALNGEVLRPARVTVSR